MTADTMRAFGVEVELDEVDWKRFAVAPGQHYEARNYHIEPDASHVEAFRRADLVIVGRDLRRVGHDVVRHAVFHYLRVWVRHAIAV